MKTSPNDKYQPVDKTALDEAKAILETAKYGTLATLDPETGDPHVSRASFCAASPGAPVILVSALAAHTPALLADPRCSILLGDVKRGDPLANARLTLRADAEQVSSVDPERAAIRDAFLAHQPKAKLYIELPDFTFFRLNIISATYVAGFGKAYQLAPEIFEI